MDIQELRSILTRLGVDMKDDTWMIKTGRGKTLLIVSRTGIDKIEKTLAIQFEYKFVSESAYVGMETQIETIKCNPAGGTYREVITIPANSGVNVTVCIRGTCSKGWSEAIGSANPDTTEFKFFADTAATRAKHKVTLKLAELYQHNVKSEDEASEFKRPARKDFAPAIDEALKKIK